MQEMIYRKNVQVSLSDIKTYPLHKIELRKSRIRNPHTISWGICHTSEERLLV